ncbi:MAG: SDR family NAD(P)-dependent oxidoreductase [Candidatus Hydrothermae bacterium]|nr:SDR family NAD(P)-dependent oxidoreductase [Candidatus Hydrothermae bacterium]
MKILLTGGAGFIGSHVADRLIEGGHDVYIVDDLSNGKIENLNEEAKFIRADIRDRERMEEIFEEVKPEIVNHHAAQISVQKSVEKPLYDAEVNVLGSLNLIDLSVKHDVKRFVYISSGGAVYGDPLYLPCDEKHPVNPLSPYGASKHAVEHYLYLYHVNYGLDYVVLRYSNIFGPRQDPFGEAGVVAIFTVRMLKGQDVHIFGDGYQERDFLYVRDVAEANLLAQEADIRLEDPLDPVFNLGTGRGTNVREIYQALAGITGYKKAPVFKERRPGEVYKISLNAEKAASVLGWRPKTTLIDGMKETVEWFKKKIG